MNLWSSLAGNLEVELISAEIPSALTAINNLGVDIYGLRWNGMLSCNFFISNRQYKKIIKLIEKRGDKLYVRKKTGVFWIGKNLLHRQILLCGLLLSFLCAWWLQGLNLFVRVEGNYEIPEKRIMESAEKYGIFFGSRRKEIRSEYVKNGLLSDIQDLQWAGVNTAGCVTTISVKEAPKPEVPLHIPQVSSIVADRDAYILSGTVLQGTMLCKPGQSVKRGQTLISGYTDSGFSIIANRAVGEIMAQTSRKFSAVVSNEYLKRSDAYVRRYNLGVLFRKKRINFWKDSGIYDTTCDRMYKEYYIILPGGYQLPFGLCIDEYRVYKTEWHQSDEKNAEEQLKRFAQEYLGCQMIAGTITDRRESVFAEENIYRLCGSYVCHEMIGRERPEQIGETNGKNS